MPSLPQPLIVRPIVLRVLRPLNRAEEKNEAPIIQGEMVSDLLHLLDTHRSMGLDGIHPRVLRELAEVLTKPSWAGVPICSRVGRLCRRIWTDWIDGLRPTI